MQSLTRELARTKGEYAMLAPVILSMDAMRFTRAQVIATAVDALAEYRELPDAPEPAAVTGPPAPQYYTPVRFWFSGEQWEVSGIYTGGMYANRVSDGSLRAFEARELHICSAFSGQPVPEKGL
jgi:hypothetical protein